MTQYYTYLIYNPSPFSPLRFLDWWVRLGVGGTSIVDEKLLKVINLAAKSPATTA